MGKGLKRHLKAQKISPPFPGQNISWWGLLNLAGLFLLPGMLLTTTLPAARKSKTYTQVYDITDHRFCHLTPRPFICRRCLKSGKRFARRLSFTPAGRPVRFYGCYSKNKK